MDQFDVTSALSFSPLFPPRQMLSYAFKILENKHAGKPQVQKLVCGGGFSGKWTSCTSCLGFSHMNHLISNWKGPIQSSCGPLTACSSVRSLLRKELTTVLPGPLNYQKIWGEGRGWRGGGSVLLPLCRKSFRLDSSTTPTRALISSRRTDGRSESGKTVKTTDG